MHRRWRLVLRTEASNTDFNLRADERACFTVTPVVANQSRDSRMQDPVVLAKASAAATWCKHATTHEQANKGKPWRYLLIPHDAIADNMTLDGLVKQFTFAGREEGK
jgi:hypothetical protein